MDVADARRIVVAFMTDTTSPPAPRHRRLRRGRFDIVEMADVVIAFICFASANSWLMSHSLRHGTPLGAGTVALTGAITSAPLLLRTRFPLSSFGAAALTIIGTAVLIRPRLLAADAYLPTS